MKKSALALAIAAAIGASGVATADTVLYGSARPSVDWTNYDGLLFDIGSRSVLTNNYEDLDGGVWDVFDNASRLGVRGSEDLGGGLSAIYQFEFGVDMTDGQNFVSNRPKWVGLKGDSWGSVTAGTQWTAYYNVLGAADVFNSSRIFRSNSPGCLLAGGFANIPGIDLWNTFDFEGYKVFMKNPDVISAVDTDGIPSANTCGTTYLGALRYDNSLMYTTPSWNGFTGQVMMVMNGLQNNQYNTVPDQTTDLDAWQLAAKYQNGPWMVGVAYDRLNQGRQNDFYEDLVLTPSGFTTVTRYYEPDTSRDLLGAALGYNTDVWGLNFNYEFQKYSYNAWQMNPYNFSLSPVDRDFKTNNYYLVGRYTFGNNILRVAWGYLNPKNLQEFYGDSYGYYGYMPDGTPIIAPGPYSGVVTNNAKPIFDVQGDHVQSVVLGWQYNFSKRTRAWVEYFAQISDTEGKLAYTSQLKEYDSEEALLSDLDNQTVTGKYPYASSNTISVGIRHDF